MWFKASKIVKTFCIVYVWCHKSIEKANCGPIMVGRDRRDDTTTATLLYSTTTTTTTTTTCQHTNDHHLEAIRSNAATAGAIETRERERERR